MYDVVCLLSVAEGRRNTFHLIIRFYVHQTKCLQQYTYCILTGHNITSKSTKDRNIIVFWIIYIYNIYNHISSYCQNAKKVGSFKVP